MVSILLGVFQKTNLVHRPVKGPRSTQAVQTQTTRKGRCHPVAVWNVFDQACADRSTTILSYHIRFRERFVEKHQFFRIQKGLHHFEKFTSFEHVRSILFGGVERFFYRPSPSDRVRWRRFGGKLAPAIVRKSLRVSHRVDPLRYF